MDRIALDTTFLIDLQNERRPRGQVRGATKFLESHPDTELLLPAVALGEYLEVLRTRLHRLPGLSSILWRFWRSPRRSRTPTPSLSATSDRPDC